MTIDANIAVGPVFEELSSEEMKFIAGGNGNASPLSVTPVSVSVAVTTPYTPYIASAASLATISFSAGVISVNQGCA